MASSIIAVTGATGFIGQHLVRDLRKQGAVVRILTRDRSNAQSLFKAGVEILEGDLSDTRKVLQLCEGAHYVFHLAAELKKEPVMRTVNVGGTRTILEALKGAAPKRFIFLSSCGVIGQNKEQYIHEETACYPEGEYENTKLEAEGLVREYCGRAAIPYTIVRPSIVFGEGKDRSDSFYQLLLRIKTGRFFYVSAGTGAANYVYVKDVADVLIFLSQSGKADNECYIVNDEVTMKELAESVKSFLGSPGTTVTVPYEPVLLASRWIHAVYPGFALTPARVKALRSPYHYSSEKLKSQAGFRYAYGIREGIKRTISWLNAKGWL